MTTTHRIIVINTPYAVMVNNLFKVGKTLGNEFGDLMHAAIGVSGESTELLMGTDRANIVEECGDIEFYLEAAWQALGRLGYEDVRHEMDGHSPHSVQVPIAALPQAIVINGGEFIDSIKKCWVYNKKPDTDRIYKILMSYEVLLPLFYDSIGVTREDVKYLNQVKLIGPNGRYPEGTYSDAAAQARADKAPGE